MSENKSHFSLYGKPPLFQVFISMVILLISGIILYTGMFLAGTLVFHVDMTTWTNVSLLEAGRKNTGFLRYLMITQDICLFIVPAILILIALKPAGQKGFSDLKSPSLTEIALVILLVFCIFPITSFAGQLNGGMHFPEWLSGVETWMTEKEQAADNAINLLMEPNSFQVMIINLFMIAILPAIGEELIFRGVFQKIFYGLFKSGHLSIWITAFLFSALHFQFFGFIPRLILGLVFGYLFFWSGTLWLPVIAHFVNNAVPVIQSFFTGAEKEMVQPDTLLWKQILSLAAPVFFSMLILLYFRNKWSVRTKKRI